MKEKPNIIFIFSDQHNPEYTGMYPGSIVRTPNLDRLAGEGVNLTNCYCPSPVCVPSRACMLTSTYPQDMGMFLNDQVMPSGWPTIAHSLGAVGYETVLDGRMHFIGPDQRHGFEKRFVGDFTWQYPGGREKNHNMRWDESPNITYGPNRRSVSVSGAGNTCALEYDSVVRDTAIKYLQERTDERPLFMVIGFFGPHNPFIGPKKYYDYYYERVCVPKVTDEMRAALHPTTRTQMNIMGLDDITEEDVRRCKAAYCSMVQKMDDDIGSILDTVYRTLGEENTVIIYASDHGELMGDKGLFYKFAMYEGSSTVPMIFKWKGRFKAGTELKNIANIVDIPPTLIDLAGGIPLPHARGISLLENLYTGLEIDEERTTCSQIAWGKLVFSGSQYQIKNVKTNYKDAASFGADEPKDSLMAMLRWREYKLIMHGLKEDEDYELFDLKKDPEEVNNVANDPSYTEILQYMVRELLKVWDPEHNLKLILRNKKCLDVLQKWYEAVGDSLEEEVWVPENPGGINYLD